MPGSERIERMREFRYLPYDEVDKMDETFVDRIVALLHHPKIDKYCVVDAYYYDYSVIPHDILDKYNLFRDSYLIFGITHEGELISRWLDRCDLDSDSPVINGEVIHLIDIIEKCTKSISIPEIMYRFNPKLLSTPCPSFFKEIE